MNVTVPHEIFNEVIETLALFADFDGDENQRRAHILIVAIGVMMCNRGVPGYSIGPAEEDAQSSCIQATVH